MQLLFWPGVALATGIIRHEIRAVDSACAPIEGPVPPGASIGVTGTIRGMTSPPGGPVTHREYPIAVDDLALRRAACAVAEPGRWVQAGRCGAHPLFVYRGRLPAGQRVILQLDGYHLAEVEVSGRDGGGACPELPPPPPPPLDERTEIGHEVRAITIPEDALYIDDKTNQIELPGRAIAALVGISELHGYNARPYTTPPQLPSPPTATATITTYRRRYDDEDADGGVWCALREEKVVALDLDGTDVDFSYGWESDATRTEGRCPR